MLFFVSRYAATTADACAYTVTNNTAVSNGQGLADFDGIAINGQAKQWTCIHEWVVLQRFGVR